MRGHRQIIVDAGGAEGICNRFGLNLNTVRSWVQRERIPHEHWDAFIRAKLATLSELHSTAKPRKRRDAA